MSAEIWSTFYTSPPLHRTVECPVCIVNCYIFANFSQTPASSSNLSTSSESQWKADSIDVLYCPYGNIRLRLLTLHWSSIAIVELNFPQGVVTPGKCRSYIHRSTQPVTQIHVKSPLLRTAVCWNSYSRLHMYSIIVNGDFITRWRNILLLGRYRTIIKLPFSSLNLSPGDFQMGDFISWHLACLAAIWTNRMICAWNNSYIFANFAQTHHRPGTWVHLWKANET